MVTSRAVEGDRDESPFRDGPVGPWAARGAPRLSLHVEPDGARGPGADPARTCQFDIAFGLREHRLTQ